MFFMSRLLTIALPTYNRAELLENQFKWLSKSIREINSEQLEILISNNNSTDETRQVIEKWRDSFGNSKVTIKHQESNIGAIRNITYCMNNASSKFVRVRRWCNPHNGSSLSYICGSTSHKELA